MLKRNKRRRKQPNLRRVKSTGPAALPNVVVPKAAKKRKRRNRRQYSLPLAATKRILTSARWLSLALLVVTAWAFVLIGQSESFYLTNIPVSGNASIAASDIVSGSGLAGAHIFSVDPKNVASRIDDLPGVISATVSIEWPNVVNIQIAEDTPVAVWVQDGERYWINDSGTLIPARAEARGLLLIESEQEESIGEATFVGDDVLDGALQLKELRPNIDRLYYLPGSGLSYQDGRGWRAYFGSGTDMEQKLAVYETIVEELVARSVVPAYISVRNHTKPYYMVNGS
jgi:cell division septal protein FtsQ